MKKETSVKPEYITEILKALNNSAPPPMTPNETMTMEEYIQGFALEDSDALQAIPIKPMPNQWAGLISLELTRQFFREAKNVKRPPGFVPRQEPEPVRLKIEYITR